MPSFIAELRRRNVLRVAAAYGLVAWIIIEAGSVLLPTFGADQDTFQVYVIIVIAGFVISLIAAWVFEITPDGVKLDKDVNRTPASDLRPGQTFNYTIIALLFIALAVSITFNVTDIRGDVRSNEKDDFAMRRSIAVLPFASLSNDPDNAFFVDGMHDDLLTRLAGFGSLKVISRTSVMEYRDTNKNLRQIGEELGVDTLLEGTVQKVGNSVRINVQLIDAETDDHLWAQTFDRELTMQNIFAIQSEISKAIAGALRATLIPLSDENFDTIPTQSIRAYSLYVSGRDNLGLRTLEALLEAREQFEQAIELDPAYAEAYVALAECSLLLYINHNALSQEDAYQLANDNLDEAFQINAELSDAYATEGLLKTNVWVQTMLGEENLEAEAAFEYAISLNPNNAQAYTWFASLRDSEQRYEDSIGLYHRAMQLDPLARIPYANLPMLYAQQGQNEVALKLWLDAVEIHPDWPTPYQNIANHLYGMGRTDEAIAWSVAAQELGTDPNLYGDFDIGAYVQFGDFDRARQLIDDLPANHSLAELRDGINRYLDRDNEGALEFFVNKISADNSAGPVIYDMAIDIALVAGDLDTARKYILHRTPILERDTELPINRFTVGQIVKLAYIGQRTGGVANGNEMLRATLPVVQSLPRLGMFGTGLLDVQILALLGRTDEALQTLQTAVDQGFRSSLPFDTWLLEDDPLLVSIRDDPRFAEVLAHLATLNGVMRERVLQALESDDWSGLRALAGAG